MDGELSPLQRRLLFVAVVIAFAVIGFYLTMSSRSAPGTGGSPTSNPTNAAVASPASAPTLTPSGRLGLPALLPIAEDRLLQAAEVARRFVAEYTTYRYDEEPQAYNRRLLALATEPLATELKKGSAGAFGAEELRRSQTVSAGTASLERARAITTQSVIFVVSARQTVTNTRGEASESRRFAVTVVPASGGWRVSDIQDAATGQAGDVG